MSTIQHLKPKSQNLTIDSPNGVVNRLALADAAAHDWYRFVLSYPPHLVRHYLDRFGFHAGATVLDPFCGTGTTIVEAKKQGVGFVGVEAHPMTHFASGVKIDWSVDPERLRTDAERIAERALTRFANAGLADAVQRRLLLEPATPYDGAIGNPQLTPDQIKLLLKNSISERPLAKALILLEELDAGAGLETRPHLRLALAKALVFSISNLHFGPEVGVGKAKPDANVVGSWLDNVAAMAADLEALRPFDDAAMGRAIRADSREMSEHIAPASLDGVICSPPYPNEKDYTRTTRLETVLLGFASTKHEMRAIKKGLVRSNTRTAYVEDRDDQYVADMESIQQIAREIEARRIELGKMSGFERMYARVTKLYFGGMAKHLAELRPLLKPGAQLAYVVGDQASYLRVMIRTGQILAEIGERLGYEVVGIDLFRTRLATATKEQLREETVVLRWNGDGR